MLKESWQPEIMWQRSGMASLKYMQLINGVAENKIAGGGNNQQPEAASSKIMAIMAKAGNNGMAAIERKRFSWRMAAGGENNGLESENGVAVMLSASRRGGG